ncbi:hypothetical protein EVAR_12534_1 [Eumeta japonica]|uniref:Uncharacterized protein n=1 Tax=Eumeta variegata TaxID=151549 RepID=A0A4C1TPP4_EUMVA|nr:hypothetical protein EVAR_12534_1 [Eumeta japonica]
MTHCRVSPEPSVRGRTRNKQRERHDRPKRSACDASVSRPLHRPMRRRETAAAYNLHDNVRQTDSQLGCSTKLGRLGRRDNHTIKKYRRDVASFVVGFRPFPGSYSDMRMDSRFLLVAEKLAVPRHDDLHGPSDILVELRWVELLETQRLHYFKDVPEENTYK